MILRVERPKINSPRAGWGSQHTFGEVFSVVKKAQCGLFRVLKEQVAAILESTANFSRNHHVGFSRVAKLDRYFVGGEGSIRTSMDEVGGSGMESSRSCKPSDVVDGSKEPGDHGWME